MGRLSYLTLGWGSTAFSLELAARTTGQHVCPVHHSPLSPLPASRDSGNSVTRHTSAGSSTLIVSPYSPVCRSIGRNSLHGPEIASIRHRPPAYDLGRANLRALVMWFSSCSSCRNVCLSATKPFPSLESPAGVEEPRQQNSAAVPSALRLDLPCMPRCQIPRGDKGSLAACGLPYGGEAHLFPPLDLRHRGTMMG